MKRTVSLLLAALMVVALVPVFGVAVAAEGDTSTTTTYTVYSEDFESLEADASSAEILAALGWYIPDANVAENIAEYSVALTADGDTVTNKALRVSTETLGIGGLSHRESFVTVFGGDVMSIVRNGDFELSYDLTYRAGTVNADGYAAMIYNYNEQSGVSAMDGTPAYYGIVAIRACGTGMNNVYYPVSGGSTMTSLEYIQNYGEVTMSNRYTSVGNYSSLYARIAGTEDVVTGEVLDADYTEADDAILSGTPRMIDKTVRVRLVYDYENGVTVYVNDVLVSTPNVDHNINEYTNAGIWNEFIDRTDAASVALVTKADVVADIDNIQIVAEKVGDAGFVDSMPELVITEVNPLGYDVKGNTSYRFAEYIEIYNPTDKYVDLAEYSLMFVDTTDGSAEDQLVGSKFKKYANYQNLGNLAGKPLTSNTTFYVTVDALKTYDSSAKRYTFVDPDTNLNTGVRYKQSGSSYVQDPAGNYCKIKYVENWNKNYTQGAADYAKNTLLAPNTCALIYLIQDNATNAVCWTAGVNAGSYSFTSSGVAPNFSGSVSMRMAYKSYGLDRNVKVLAMNAFNLADNPNGTGNRRYYIGKANYDQPLADGTTEINYKNVYITDSQHDKYVVSYCDWNSSVINGVLYEGEGVNDEFFGKGGMPSTSRADNYSYWHSGVYVYGLNASDDPRHGLLYNSNNRVNNGTYAHVGRLANYQKILMEQMYAKANKSGQLSDLMITEIVPRTYNLAGENYNAFSAIEITNTSSESLDLYRYALVATTAAANIDKNAGFNRSTVFQAGNPVEKGIYNGAYYYFIDNSISNPEKCVVASGETVVIWLITNDTYQSYSRDEDFGFDYFREYWAKQGNTQLAMRGADGGYATKVIAVDANNSEITNGDNYKRVFNVDPTYSAVYGVASASTDVKNGVVKNQDVISATFFAASAIQYSLDWKKVEDTTGTYYANILTRTVPVNMGMRYLPGGGGNLACSAMMDSLRVQYWNFSTSGRVYFSDTNPNALPCVEIVTSSGAMEPRLGTLDGKENYAVMDHMFHKTVDQAGNVDYRYFDDYRTGVYTVEGAAINTKGSNPMLRFDNAVSNSLYTNLVATYGKNVQIGMLIVETSLLGDKTVFTEKELQEAGIAYKKVESKFLYRDADYTMLGASVAVSSENYNTSYTAIGYMTVTLADGTVKSYVSPVSTARSLADVAADALNDVNAEKTDVYLYSVGEEGGYSRYTKAVQNKLRGYAGL